MNKTKLFTILKYIVVIGIMTYSLIRSILLIVNLIDSYTLTNLIGLIIYAIILLVSIIALVLLVKKSLYKAKFNHDNFN